MKPPLAGFALLEGNIGARRLFLWCSPNDGDKPGLARNRCARDRLRVSSPRNLSVILNCLACLGLGRHCA